MIIATLSNIESAAIIFTLNQLMIFESGVPASRNKINCSYQISSGFGGSNNISNPSSTPVLYNPMSCCWLENVIFTHSLS